MLLILLRNTYTIIGKIEPIEPLILLEILYSYCSVLTGVGYRIVCQVSENRIQKHLVSVDHHIRTHQIQELHTPLLQLQSDILVNAIYKIMDIDILRSKRIAGLIQLGEKSDVIDKISKALALRETAL